MGWLKERFVNLKERVLGVRPAPWEKGLFIVIALFFLVNATYVSYPDEFVNFLAGQSINHGGLPYRDFFDHHLPFAWYLSAILLRFSGDFILFRLLWAGFAFVLLYLLGSWLRKNYREFYNYYLGFFITYPLLAVYFWFHLFIADSLAVLFFSIAFWLLIVQTLTNRVNFKTLVVASLATFAMLFSSLTFLYIAAALYLWQLYLVGFKNKKLVLFILYSATPYLVYLLYLMLSGTFSDFYFANVTYNKDLYISIPNYTKGGRFFNPLKFGLTLIHNFYQGYLPLLSKIKHLDLYLPVGVLSGLSTLLLLLLLSLRNFSIAAIFFLILSFSAPRGNIENYKETDYQSAMFLVLGLISAMIVLYLLKRFKSKEEILNDVRRVAQFLVAVFFFFTFIFLLYNTYKKFFLRYTQQMPGITNYSYGAQFVDRIIDEGDYFWMGPYEPHHEFFVKKGRLPGKYPTLLPQFRENDFLKQSFIEQFEKNPPKVIVYLHEASIFQTPALEFGEFFLDWMDSKYTSLENVPNINTLRSPSEFNLRTDLYVRNDKLDEVLENLRNQGYIENSE